MSLSYYQSTQSMRFIASPRDRKDARCEITGPTSQSTGVTNMCFKNDESDEVGHYRLASVNSNHLCNSRRSVSEDSGCFEGTSPLTPLSDVSSTTSPIGGLYHRAMSRKKSLSHLEIDNSEVVIRKRSETYSGGDTVVQYNRHTAAKRNLYDANAQNPSKNSGTDSDDVFSPMTSPDKDLMTFDKGRSMSWAETTNSDFIPVKPRCFSQPLIRDVPDILNNALADIDEEEEILIDSNGISRTVKRRELAEISDPVDSGVCNMKSPLLEEKSVHENKVTIYPGYQQKAGISLNEWQVNLGNKEPAKCRCDGTPKPTPPPKPPSSEDTEPYDYITGNETSIGGNSPMTTSEVNDEIVGVEVEVGSSREMSQHSIVDSEANCPTASAGRRKKSLKTIFRLGFLTTKTRKKSKADDKTPSPDAGYKYPLPHNRLRQRRVSRLEMNEPIEDIFSEVKFATIQKRPTSANSGGGLRRSSADESDDDIVEDPEVIMQSFLKTNHEEVGVDVTAGDHHDDDSNKSEKELLLPEDDNKPCSLVPLCDDNRKETPEEDLR